MTIEVDNINSRIVDNVPYMLSRAIGDELSYIPTFAQYTVAYKAASYRVDKDGVQQTRKWDGRYFLWNYKKKTFPTGVLPRVRRVLNEHNYKVKIIDKRNRVKKVKNYEFLADREDNKKINIRYYQQEAIDEALTQSRGIISHATGTGKTVTFTKLICDIGVEKTIIFVPTKDLLYQTKYEMENMIRENGKPVKIGIIGDGNVNIQDITICIINSALYAYGMRYDYSKHRVIEDKRKRIQAEEKAEKDTISARAGEIKEFIESVELVIADECHRASTVLWKTPLSYTYNALYRFGFSATPYREDGREMEIEGIFGRIIHYYPLEKAIQEDYLMNPEIYLIKYDYDPMGAYIKESRDLKEREEEEGEWMESYEWNYKTTYNEIVVFNEDLNQKIAEIANKFKNKNMSVLILVKEYPQGELIEKYLENGLFLTGKDTSKKRNVTIDMVRNRDLPVLVATTIADMGLDLPSLDVLIMAGGGGSDPTKFINFKKKSIEKGKWDIGENNEDNRFGGVIEQRIGRVVRKHENKQNAIIIDIWHANKKMKKQSAARRKIYKDRKLNSKIINFDELPCGNWQNQGEKIF